MAKHQRQVVAQKDNTKQQIQHSEFFDDNLLPDAAEIEKLHSIDPDIINWLKKSAEKEQGFRHKYSDDRLRIADQHDRRTHNTTRLGLAVYFLLFTLCLGLAYFLIKDDKNIQGSIFGGAAAIMALAVIISGKQQKTS